MISSFLRFRRTQDNDLLSIIPILVKIVSPQPFKFVFIETFDCRTPPVSLFR